MSESCTEDDFHSLQPHEVLTKQGSLANVKDTDFHSCRMTLSGDQSPRKVFNNRLEKFSHMRESHSSVILSKQMQEMGPSLIQDV